MSTCMEDIKTKTPWFVLNSPELGMPFQEFIESCQNSGVLNDKTKQLLLLAVAVIFRCPQDIRKHIEQAQAYGASREEITEVLILLAMETARTQLEWADELYQKQLRPQK